MPFKQNKEFFDKYFREHFGRINPPKILVHENGWVDFDFGDEMLHTEGQYSYAGLLEWYLGYKIGHAWLASEAKKTIGQPHPITEWDALIAAQSQKSITSAEQPCFIGARICWRYLGYHLSIISEHAVLTRILLKRLKNAHDFQSARFEIRVAAAVIAAGFDLEYKPEKGEGTHPEFIATDIDSGRKFAVEAKSKRRNGLMGFKNPKEDQESLAVGARRLLRDAVSKDTELPLIAFVELNLPDPFSSNISNIADELHTAWTTLDRSNWKDDDFPCVGGLFTNDAAIYCLDKKIDLAVKYGWCYRFDFENRHKLDAQSFLTRIERGFAATARIPEIEWTFDNYVRPV